MNTAKRDAAIINLRFLLKQVLQQKHLQLCEGWARSYDAVVQQGERQMRDSSTWPSWQSKIRAKKPFKKEDDNSTVDDETDLAKPAASSFRVPSEKDSEDETAREEPEASASQPQTPDKTMDAPPPQSQPPVAAASSFLVPSEKESKDETPMEEPAVSPSQPQALEKTMDAPPPQSQAPAAAKPDRNPRTSSAGGDGEEGSYLSGRLYQVQPKPSLLCLLRQWRCFLLQRPSCSCRARTRVCKRGLPILFRNCASGLFL